MAVIGILVVASAQEPESRIDWCADVDDALNRLEKKRTDWLPREVENLREELQRARNDCSRRLLGYLGVDRPVCSLEWIGGFQGGYNIFILAERSAFVSRIDVCGNQMILGLPAAEVTNLLARICSPNTPLNSYNGGAPVDLAFDTPILFGRFSWSNSPPRSVVTYYPRKSPIAPVYTNSQMVSGYFELAGIMQTLEDLIQGQKFGILYKNMKKWNEAFVVPEKWFYPAFH